MALPSGTSAPPPAAGNPAPDSPSDWLAEYPPPRSLPLDQEALRVFEHAHAIGLVVESEDSPAITFTTLIVALLEGSNDTSGWFSRHATILGVNIDAIFSEKKIDRKKAASLKPSRKGKPEPLRFSRDKQVLTVSARNVLETAEGWAQRVGGSDIGVRHLVAAYVVNPPPAHRQQLESWSFQHPRWRPSLFSWVASRYTAERWTDASQRPAPAAAAPVFEQQNVSAESLEYPGDAQTMAVLEQAARFHARVPDQFLRLQTVFHALVEKAREDPATRNAIRPLLDTVDAVPGYAQGLKPYLGAADAKAPVAFKALNVSPRVLNALETARGLAVAARATDDARVAMLHLAGALVSRRVDSEEVLAPMGLDAQALRLALIDHAGARGESVQAWREALGEHEDVEDGRPLELSSDEAEAVVRQDDTWESDPLRIRRDVKTFAALLASRKLDPPLAIGLFGPWGSGKTTFLKRLSQEVESLADEARGKDPARTPFVGNVVSVEFNAWHFAEAALTSSLVDTILRKLSDHIKDEELVVGKAWREQKLERFETAKRNVEAAQAVEEAARTAVANAERDLTARRADAIKAATGLESVIKRVWAATRKAVEASPVVKNSGVLDAVGASIKSTEELRDRLTTLRNRPARLLGDLGWGKSLLFAGLVLAVPPLVAWLVQHVLKTGGAAQALSSMTAAVSLIGVWARSATGAVAKVDQAVAEVAAEYDRQVNADPGFAKARETLDAAQASAATAAAGLEAARQELARAHAEAANATLPAQMLQLVSGRLDAGTYNKELTTLSLARADLKALSDLLREHRSAPATTDTTGPAAEDPAAKAPAAKARPVDRVILYVDDLDRCKPEDVVRVLQLVHMLLAFELFVVVVAVDARWVGECLKYSYQWLADDQAGPPDPVANTPKRPMPTMGHLSPQDYLEKIFQIAFWLEPMTVTQAADYLGSLIRSPSREGTGPRLNAPGMPAAEVEIKGIELDYMRYLAKYVGSSPRRVKRFVNAYRLIKAGMSNTELGTFLTKRTDELTSAEREGPYQLVIGLLVIGTGAPSSSAQILSALAECDPGMAITAVVSGFRGRNLPDWTLAAQVIEVVMQSQEASQTLRAGQAPAPSQPVTVAELRGWARRVRRFLLSGGR